TISKLVQMCKERDPRLIRMEERERRAIMLEERQKEQRRQEREAERLRKEQEIEEKERKREEERQMEQRRVEQEKDRIRREIQQLPIEMRKLFNKPFFQQQKISEKHIDCVCLHATREELKTIVHELQASPQKQLDQFHHLFQVCKQRELDKKTKKEELEKKEKETNKFGTLPWTVAELKHLTQLCIKFPRGTENRWDVIYKEFLRKQKSSPASSNQSGKSQPYRSLEELIATAHDLQKGNIKMPTKKDTNVLKKNTDVTVASATATASSTSSSGKTKTLSPLEKELAEIRSRYETDVSDESWTKAQNVLETVLRELMPVKKEQQWSMETFWEQIGKRLADYGKTPTDCEERFKYVREVLICKKKYQPQ
ncbi:hypothetical protein RFI_07685, partial [Reticulomyxa filosa]